MAAKKEVAPKAYPSEFGSHTVMIDQEATEKIGDPNKVVCKDQFGVYETERFRLDSNMADPNRWTGTRVKKEKETKEKS